MRPRSVYTLELPGGDFVEFEGDVDPLSVRTKFSESGFTSELEITNVTIIERGNRYDKQGAD